MGLRQELNLRKLKVTGAGSRGAIESVVVLKVLVLLVLLLILLISSGNEWRGKTYVQKLDMTNLDDIVIYFQRFLSEEAKKTPT